MNNAFFTSLLSAFIDYARTGTAVPDTPAGTPARREAVDAYFAAEDVLVAEKAKARSALGIDGARPVIRAARKAAEAATRLPLS